MRSRIEAGAAPMGAAPIACWVGRYVGCRGVCLCSGVFRRVRGCCGSEAAGVLRVWFRVLRLRSCSAVNSAHCFSKSCRIFSIRFLKSLSSSRSADQSSDEWLLLLGG